tara:strand:+ start:51 stop:536 length:486 start_codon:yes stop_codon:yes gene_type:complete
MNQWCNEGSARHSLFTDNRFRAFLCLIQRKRRVYPTTTGDELPGNSTANNSNSTIYVQRPVIKSYVLNSSTTKVVIRPNRPREGNWPGGLVINFQYQIFGISSSGINTVDKVATCSAYHCFDNRRAVNQTLPNGPMLRRKNPVIVYPKPPINRPRARSCGN